MCSVPSGRRSSFGVAALLVGAVIAVFVAAVAPAPRQTGTHPPETHLPVWQKGMTYTHGYRHADNLLSAGSRASLQYLKSGLHVEWIALNPFAHQRVHNGPRIGFGDDPPDDHLRHAIAAAHRLGIKVMLKPHISLVERRDGIWRGSIAMETEEDWQRWFGDYERFINHYARLAAASEVELFCVGVELAGASLNREADWRRVIDQVRERYHGPLVYAANWWEEYDLIPFWDALDYIGVNAFFPLSQTPDPTLHQLRLSARTIATDISLLHQLTGKPVIFTEIGYKSIRGTSVRPWEWPRRFEPAGNISPDSRVRA